MIFEGFFSLKPDLVYIITSALSLAKLSLKPQPEGFEDVEYAHFIFLKILDAPYLLQL